MAGDFKVVRKDMDELRSIIDNLRSSKSLDDIFTTNMFEELRRVVSSCEVPIRKFDDLLSTLREWKIELSELDLTPFMHGIREEPFACIFTICTQETPLKVFRSPGGLLWHLYHSHGLNIEPVGKPKHPGFWETILLKSDDWETNWRQGWDKKKELVDEILTNSIDWERINSPERTCETSIAGDVGRKPSLDDLRCSLLLSIRGNEFGLTIKLKALILRIYLDISSAYEPCCPSGSEILYILTDVAQYWRKITSSRQVRRSLKMFDNCFFKSTIDLTIYWQHFIKHEQKYPVKGLIGPLKFPLCIQSIQQITAMPRFFRSSIHFLTI